MTKFTGDFAVKVAEQIKLPCMVHSIDSPPSRMNYCQFFGSFSHLQSRKKLIKNCCFLGCKLGCIGACFNERKCNPMYQHNALKSSRETARMHRHDAFCLMNNAWNHARKYLHCTWNFESALTQRSPLAFEAHPIIVADFLSLANWFSIIISYSACQTKHPTKSFSLRLHQLWFRCWRRKFFRPDARTACICRTRRCLGTISLSRAECRTLRSCSAAVRFDLALSLPGILTALDSSTLYWRLKRRYKFNSMKFYYNWICSARFPQSKFPVLLPLKFISSSWLQNVAETLHKDERSFELL